MKTLNPYLTFDGTCEAAFNFYKSIFGTEISFLTRYGEVPPTEKPLPAAAKNKIMHAVLPLSGDNILFGADALAEFPFTPPVSRQPALSLYFPDDAEARRIFTALSDGGSISISLQTTFWAKLYGLCVDKFGIVWMISSGEKEMD